MSEEDKENLATFSWGDYWIVSRLPEELRDWGEWNLKEIVSISFCNAVRKHDTWLLTSSVTTMLWACICFVTRRCLWTEWNSESFAICRNHSLPLSDPVEFLQLFYLSKATSLVKNRRKWLGFWVGVFFLLHLNLYTRSWVLKSHVIRTPQEGSLLLMWWKDEWKKLKCIKQNDLHFLSKIREWGKMVFPGLLFMEIDYSLRAIKSLWNLLGGLVLEKEERKSYLG